MEANYHLTQSDLPDLITLHERYLQTTGLSGRKLFVQNMTVIDFDFSKTNLSDAIFIGCSFSRCKFQSLKLNNSKFQKCTFDDADFYKCEISNCTFDNASFMKSNLSDAIIRRSNFKQCFVLKTTFIRATIDLSDFQGSTLINLELNYAAIRSSNFSNINALIIDFAYANIRETDFHGSAINGSDFHGTVFETCIFAAANLLGYKDYEHNKLRQYIGMISCKSNFRLSKFVDCTLDSAIYDENNFGEVIQIGDISKTTQTQTKVSKITNIIKINNLIFIAFCVITSSIWLGSIFGLCGKYKIVHDIYALVMMIPFLMFLVSNIFTSIFYILHVRLLNSFENTPSNSAFDVKSRLVHAIYKYSITAGGRIVTMFFFFMPTILLIAMWADGLKYKTIPISISHLIMIAYSFLSSMYFLSKIKKDILKYINL